MKLITVRDAGSEVKMRHRRTGTAPLLLTEQHASIDQFGRQNSAVWIYKRYISNQVCVQGRK